MLVADIDRGGVFAHLIGTLACLSETERGRIRGFVINRFRGDLGLLQPGLDWLEAQTGKPVLGVVPYLHGLTLDAEDMLPSQLHTRGGGDGDVLEVIVPALPRISNHTDFDADCARARAGGLFLRRAGVAPPPADLIVLPGSKSVQRDLAWLRERSVGTTPSTGTSGIAAKCLASVAACRCWAVPSMTPTDSRAPRVV